MFQLHTRRRVLAATALSLAALASAPVLAQDASKPQLIIGGTAGSNIDQLQAGIVPLLKAKG